MYTLTPCASGDLDELDETRWIFHRCSLRRVDNFWGSSGWLITNYDCFTASCSFSFTRSFLSHRDAGWWVKGMVTFWAETC